MAGIKPGTRVRVEYEGKVVSRYGDGTWVQSSAGQYHYYHPGAASITPREPAHWPPQIGDTWKADDGLYCIRLRPGTGDPVADGIDHYGYFTDMEDFKDLDPELLFRPEQD